MTPKARIKGMLGPVAKFAFAGGLLYYLAHKGFLSLGDTARAFRHWGWVATGWFFMTVSMILGIVRWHFLLAAQEIHLAFGRTARLGMIGNFFNIALPGAVSGDFVKAVYVAREAEGKTAPAFSSILFDRVVGVSALLLVSALALLLSAGNAWSGKLFNALEIFLFSTGTGVVGFYAYLFLLKDHHDPVLYLLTRVALKFPKWGEGIKHSYEGLRTYRRHRSVVVMALGMSLLIQGLVILACALFANALGEQDLPLRALFVVVPLGLLVTAVPVTPAGVGAGNAAFAALFGLLGGQLDAKAGANVFNFFLVGQFAFGALGGLVYLRFKRPDQPLVLVSGV